MLLHILCRISGCGSTSSVISGCDYDEVPRISSCSRASSVGSICGDISVVLIHTIDMIEAGKGELATHLSHNQTLHNYKEMAEEQLVLTL